MTSPSRIVMVAGGERGAVVVMFALFAPVAILLAAFAIDSGNWFLHKRHLQVQADAGALAAAQEFQPCVNANIYATAGQYSGAASVTTPSGSVTSSAPLYNAQVGGTPPARMHELINSKTYYNQASPVDGTAAEKTPCEALMVDVKMTETGLPWYWRAFSSVPYINAHARVEIQQQSTATKVEPLAVAEPAPVAAAAYFVDEDNKNAVLKTTALTDLGPNSEGQEVWGNASVPVELAVNHPHIGVVIALSGNRGDTTCGHPNVECFGRKAANEKATLASAEPPLHIAGYALAGTGTMAAPLVRQVTLSTPSPNTCTDGYFSSSAATCTLTVSAKVDYASAITKGVTVAPVVGGTVGSAMTFNAGTGLWSGSASLPAGSGSKEISLLIKCKQEATSPCPAKATEATVKDVHRAYAASATRSGSIKGAWLSEVGGLPQDANSYEVCEAQNGNSCTHKLVVTVDVEGSLANAAGFADPLRQLKFEGNQGVIVGCPPTTAGEAASEYREHLANGCPGSYKLNTADPNCTGTTEPFDCLKVGIHGKKTGALSGIAERVESKPGTHFYCANNWQNNNAGGVPVIPKDDSRIVEVFIMPYGSVNEEGQALLASGQVPIQDFAVFYVTGFPGDSCKSDPKTGNAEIVGHFIKYINTLNTGGGQKCVLNSLGTCVAVLTR
jgi:Putative Flp pilus-assembly TadE/G-like